MKPETLKHIRKHALILVLTAFLAFVGEQMLGLDFYREVNDSFVDYAEHVQPLSLAGDFFHALLPEPHYDPSRGWAPASESPVMTLARIPLAFWTVFQKAMAQGIWSVLAMLVALVIGFAAALDERGFENRARALWLAPLIGFVAVELTLLLVVVVAVVFKVLATLVVAFVVDAVWLCLKAAGHEGAGKIAENLVHKAGPRAAAREIASPGSVHLG